MSVRSAILTGLALSLVLTVPNQVAAEPKLPAHTAELRPSLVAEARKRIVDLPQKSRKPPKSKPKLEAKTESPKRAGAQRALVKRRRTKKVSRSYTNGWSTAMASWYGPGFYGHTMAGGGKLEPTSMIVAHKTLPFGTKLEIGYHGRTCIATVRDRGPYVAGRAFDLGPGTAHALGFSGVGRISYRILR